jgi:hypothetical protein
MIFYFLCGFVALCDIIFDSHKATKPQKIFQGCTEC